MKDAFPGVIRHHLGDAEFTLLITVPENPGRDRSGAGTLHCHRYFEVHCNTGSPRILTLPTGEIKLETNQLLLICPGCMHYSVPYTEDYLVLSFELRQDKGEDGFYRHFSSLLTTLHLKSLPADRKYRSLLQDFFSAGHQNTVMHYCQIKLKGLSVLVALLENLAAYAGICGDAAYIPERSEAFDAALDMMIYGTHTLQQIAQQLGYSERHTARLIHSRYGASLSHIRKQLALESQKHLEETV